MAQGKFSIRGRIQQLSLSLQEEELRNGPKEILYKRSNKGIARGVAQSVYKDPARKDVSLKSMREDDPLMRNERDNLRMDFHLINITVLLCITHVRKRCDLRDSSLVAICNPCP